jgi:hypothetical protein
LVIELFGGNIDRCRLEDAMVEVGARYCIRMLTAALAVLVLLPGCGIRSALSVDAPQESALETDAGAGMDSGEDSGGPGEEDAEADADHCGNGVIEIELGEQCDGDNLGGATCEALGEGPGTLSCFDNCFFDISMCEITPPTGYGDGGEWGDGGDIRPGDGGEPGPIL